MAMHDDLMTAAIEAAGNWRKSDSFAWYDQPENPEQWFIFYTHNRDSGLCDESNAAEIDKLLEPYLGLDEEVCRKEEHNHWACGWVAGYAVRVFDRTGAITPVFKEVHRINMALADYPLLNDEDYSSREYEATLDNIGNEGRLLVKDDAPANWERLVFSWLWDNNQGEVENIDGQGGYPNREAILVALEDLGLTESQEDDEP